MADSRCCAKSVEMKRPARLADQRRVLIIVMVISFAMFVAEFVGGWIAGSAAVMADAVDMFGDAVVYALSLYALQRGPKWEAGAAIAKGGIILVFGAAVLLEIADKLTRG